MSETQTARLTRRNGRMLVSKAYLREERVSGHDEWPYTVPAVRALGGSGLAFSRPLTFLVGENGSGKSTVVEAIAEAYGLDARGGRAGRKYVNDRPLMHRLGRSGAQVICATHSPVLAATPDADIVELGDDGLRRTSWDQLELVDHWRRYLDDPRAYLRHVVDPPR